MKNIFCQEFLLPGCAMLVMYWCFLGIGKTSAIEIRLVPYGFPINSKWAF